MTEGTSRTLKWMAGGMRRSSGEADAKPEPKHSRRTIGLTIGVALIVVMWIGWTAYVWTENGSTAGIGVLISWPAVLAAVTLVTAPFIGGAVAVRRHRASEPVFAGAVVPEAKETKPEPVPEVKSGDAEEPPEDKPEDDEAGEEAAKAEEAAADEAGDPSD